MEQPLTKSQQKAFDKIKDFLGNDGDVFVLKGYAGTGKTHLIKYITHYLDENKTPYEVLAPTGRAAKVLRDRVGKGRTIHSCIFNFDIICTNEDEDEVDESANSYQLFFPIVEQKQDYQIMIIDESSMISNVKTQNEYLTFGSGVLLNDLLQFTKVCGINKLIFVGDPAQLPPVMDPHSYALDPDYLSSLGHKVDSVELTDVVRQEDNNAILAQATKLRDLLTLPRKSRHNLSLDADGKDIIELQAGALSETFTDEFPVPEVGNGITVCFSNNRCFQVNQAIRSIIFPGEEAVQVGDIVIINNNNYKSYGIQIFNGDMAKVTRVGEIELHPNVPVTIKGEKRHVDLAFRDIDLFFSKEDITITCKVFDDLLHSGESDLSVWQMRAVYIDFILRHQHLKRGTPEFKEALMNDPYFNAVKVKFGYAVTCHKSQGGEWDTVFVDYSGRCGLSDDHLRWCYTATTRAKNRLFTINAPHITSFDRLTFTPISKFGKAPKNFWQEDDSLATTYHPSTDLIGVRLKHLGIEEALKETDFKLHNVVTCNWQDKFDFVSSTGEQVHIEVYYDGAGFFKLVPITGEGSSRDMLAQLINTSMAEPRNFKYEPSDELMRELFQRVTTAAIDADVKIVNVVEMLKQYYVEYHLITDARFALIKFYVNEKGLSAAVPMSELGADDEKLKRLIEGMVNE
jgi:hypothetical protein